MIGIRRAAILLGWAVVANASVSLAREVRGERPGPAVLRQPVPRLGDTRQEALADSKREETLRDLKRVLEKLEPSSPDRAELLFQLAELYWEKSKSRYRKEMARLEEEERQADRAKARGERITAPAEDHTESERDRAEAMKLYAQILRDHPGYSQRDEVLFSLGLNLSETGAKAAAVARYQQLIREFPSSRFTPDAYVELGNYYFEEANDLPKARDAYEKAFASKSPKVSSFALYKLAWCDFNSTSPGRHQAALKKLQQVVESASGKAMVDLRNEALNDLVRVFIELNQAEQAIAYFQAKAPQERQAPLIGKLAEMLAAAGNHESAIKTYQRLLALAPRSPSAPLFQQAVVKSLEGLRRRDAVRTEAKRLIESYGPRSSWWNDSGTGARREAFDTTEELLRSLATEYHQEAQKTQQVETFRLARDVYKLYVDAFASSQDEALVSDFAFNLRFFYAETLWALEEWADAAAAYGAVAVFRIPSREEAKAAADASYSAQAAYNTVLAYDQLLKRERGLLAPSRLKEREKVQPREKKARLGKDPKPRQGGSARDAAPLTRVEQQLVAACDRFSQLAPNHPDEIDVRYQAAMVLYEKNHLDEAAKRWGEIILRWPKEQRARDVAELTLHALEARGEWLELGRVSRVFAANTALAPPGSAFAERVSTLADGARYKWIEDTIYRKEKQPEKAAEEFLKLAVERPRSDQAPRALAYAMILLQEAQQPERATQVGERALAEHPRSDLSLKVRYTLAHLYEEAFAFRKAAQMYEAFVAAYDATARARGPAKPRRSPSRRARPSASSAERDALVKEASGWVADALFNAGLGWERLGQPERAVAAYRGYTSRFADRPDVPEIHHRVALMHSRDKNWREAKQAFRAFNVRYRRDPRATPALRYLAKFGELQAARKLNLRRDANELEDELIRSYQALGAADRRDPRVLTAFAQTRFDALEPLWDDYLRTRLTNVARLAKALETKTQQLQKVESAYAEILAIGAGEVGIAALTRVGLAYADFAKNMVDSPEPRGLDEEQLELYREELQKRALPLEEKAIDMFETAVAKSFELSLYTRWTLLAQDQLNLFHPGTYPRVRELPYRSEELFGSQPRLMAAEAVR